MLSMCVRVSCLFKARLYSGGASFLGVAQKIFDSHMAGFTFSVSHHPSACWFFFEQGLWMFTILFENLSLKKEVDHWSLGQGLRTTGLSLHDSLVCISWAWLSEDWMKIKNESSTKTAESKAWSRNSLHWTCLCRRKQKTQPRCFRENVNCEPKYWDGTTPGYVTLNARQIPRALPCSSQAATWFIRNEIDLNSWAALIKSS